ncbi:MAG: hypothetical protein RLY20_3379 [Verrucomicrobiota bacterium]
MEKILNSQDSDAAISSKLIAIFPELPADQQEDLISQLAAQVSDKDYASLGNMLTNKATTVDVAEVLMTDLIDRPDSIRLPLLLDVARSPDHPKAEDAHDLLEVLLDVNYHNDWDAWAKKISEWLASHPEKMQTESL